MEVQKVNRVTRVTQRRLLQIEELIGGFEKFARGVKESYRVHIIDRARRCLPHP
jgi:hypothetical protein